MGAGQERGAGDGSTGGAADCDGEGGGGDGRETWDGGAADTGAELGAGGHAGTHSGSTAAGLSRSMEIVTGLSLLRTTKVLVSRLMTGNGPSKGGTSGRRTASTRMKT